MKNPIIQMLNQSNARNNISPILKMMRTVKSANNPMAMINMLAQQNPQVKQAMDLVSANNGDARKAFYDLAKDCGVNPEDILKMLK